MPKLTIRNIQNIKADARDVFAWDDELRGFGVRVKGHFKGPALRPLSCVNQTSFWAGDFVCL